MQWRTLFGAILFFFSMLHTGFARDRWLLLRTSNFELLTESEEKDGRDALKFFEEVRIAFTQVLGLKLPEAKPVTIIAFRNEEAFAPYRPQAGVAAFSLSMPAQEFIVMQDLNPAHYPVALHELTHVIISQAGIQLPLWLNEGFAEFYATLIPAGGKIRVGRIIPERLQVAQGGLIGLHELLSVDRKSALYHDSNRVGIFYAESWALVHMLKFSDDYARRFEKVLDAIGRGESSEQALQVVYGKNLQQILIDLQSYVHGGKFREGVIKARLDKAIPEAKIMALDPVNLTVLLTSIQARGPLRPLAINSLKELAITNPERLAPVEALAWLELNGSNPQGAIQPFRRALELGTRDANLCFQFAMRLRAAIPDTDYVAALRRAADVDPTIHQAQEQLAAHAFNSHDYKETIARLHMIRKLDRSNAFPYYRMLSAAAFETGDLVEAKSAAMRAEQYAKTDEEKRIAEELRKLLDAH